MKRLSVIAPLVTIGVVAASYVGWNTSDGSSAKKRTSSAQPASDNLAQGPATTNNQLPRLVKAFEAKNATNPNATSLSFLGGLYLQRARQTGDGDSYALARDSFQAAIKRFPNDMEAQGSLATALASLHDFKGSLKVAEALLAQDPALPSAIASAGDAHLELGNYTKAESLYQQLAELVPESAAVVARLGRIAYLNGNSELAQSEQARAYSLATASALRGAGLAWYSVAQSSLAWELGDYENAKLFAERAREEAPDYYLSNFALARVSASLGEPELAIKLYEKLLEKASHTEMVAALGTLYESVGNDKAAAKQYREVIEIAAAADGLENRHLVNFEAEHGVNIAEALALAEKELTSRTDVLGWDAYAWALHANGRDAEALVASRKALALGTPSALLRYHAGAIEAALGNLSEAREFLTAAIKLNPQFDPLQADVARELLASLG